MSHPDDMGPQEDLVVGCFILFIFAIVFVMVVTIGSAFGYFIYHLFIA